MKTAIQIERKKIAFIVNTYFLDCENVEANRYPAKSYAPWVEQIYLEAMLDHVVAVTAWGGLLYLHDASALKGVK